MKKLLGAVATIAAVTASVGANAGTMSIDLFDTGPQVAIDTVNGGSMVWAPQVGSALDTSIIGGYRDIGTNLLIGGNSTGTRNSTIAVADGVLDFSTSTQTVGTGIVRWDGVNSSPSINPTGLGGLNLTSFTNFAVGVVFSDQGYEFQLRAFTDALNYTVVSLIANGHSSPITTYIPLNAFLACGFNAGGIRVDCTGSGVNWANVGALELDINTSATVGDAAIAVDLTLDQIQAVPEPASLALVGLGLLGLGALRRRSSKA